MNLRDQIKILIIQAGYTLTDVVNEYNIKNDKNVSLQNFSSKLKKGSIRYSEVEEILDIIGYKIEWTKKETTER